MARERLKGLLEGEWFQCQGTSDILKEEELGDQLKVPKGHAIFHISKDGKLDLIIFAERDSLGIGKTPCYPIVSLILDKVLEDLGKAKGQKHCPSCQGILKKLT